MRAQELKGYLRKGIRLDELWRVARGEVKYADFASSQQQNGAAAAVAAPPPSVPDELVPRSDFDFPEKGFLHVIGATTAAAESGFCATPQGACCCLRDQRVPSGAAYCRRGQCVLSAPAQVNIQAYLLWEKAGRPEGADFAADARSTLQAQLASGRSLQELESALKAPEPQARRWQIP